MKHILLILTCLAGITITYGQTVIEVRKDNDTNRIFTKVEEEAGFPGGDTAWRHFLQKNLNAFVAIDNGAKKGRYTVIVKFIVSKDGTITDVYCENDPGYGMCQESVRVIKKTLKWIPAKVNGHNVNAYRRQPFTFQIE